MRVHIWIRRYLPVGVAGLAVAAVVAACGGSSGSGNSPSSSGAAARPAGTNGASRGPAASGKIAAVEAASFEVQNSTVGQLTVDYSATTRFTQTVPATLADIAVGSCVVAINANAGSGTTTSPSTIMISPATNGSCVRTGGFGGNAPGGGNFTPGGTGRPSGFPSGRPSGFRSGGAFPGAGNFANAFTSGKVTAKSGDTLTVAAVSFNRFGASSSAAPSAATTPKTVTISASTKITKDATVSAKALRVGLCASAEGASDSSGAVTATTVAITAPDSAGSCDAGAGRFTRGGNFPGAGAGSGGAS